MQAIQQNRTIYHEINSNQRCKSGEKCEAQKRTSGTFAHDFLRHTFLPIRMFSGEDNCIENEKHFFISLRNIESHYKLTPTPYSDLPYPLNILDAFTQIREKVDSFDGSEKLFLVNNGNNPYCLSIGKPFEIGNVLYFLPIKPLVMLLHNFNRKRRSEAYLLLSVCAYLFQIVEVSGYVNGGGLAHIYHILTEWVEEEHDEGNFYENDDTEEREEYYQNAISELNQAKYFGRQMESVLNHQYHLDNWQKRLDQFNPKSERELEIFKMAEGMFDLYSRYPERKFSDQFFSKYWSNDDEDMMVGDHCVSFVWSYDGWLGEETERHFNDLAESYQSMEAPTEFCLFDVPGGRTADNLAFEKSLLTQLNALAYLLNTISS